MIEAKLGPSASEVHHFDVALLEKQALKILKLEDDLAKTQGRPMTSNSHFIPTIIAACCYIQTKQSKKWAVPMKDFTRVCKLIGASRPSRAVDLVTKWNCKIVKNEIGKDYEESALKALEKQ